MRPQPIDFARITHQPEIKSFTIDKDKHGVTALLKNGRALRLVHMGCAHSGAEAALWFESKIPFLDDKQWRKEAVALAKIAFSPDIAKDIESSLKNGKFEKNSTETRLVITAKPTEYFSYVIVVEPESYRVVLSISYSIGG